MNCYLEPEKQEPNYNCIASELSYQLTCHMHSA